MFCHNRSHPMPRSPRKFHVAPSKSGRKLFTELVNVKIITNVLQRTIFDVSFSFHDRKAANNSKRVQFREHYKLRAAAILFLFALITHDPPTSAKSSISRHSADDFSTLGTTVVQSNNQWLRRSQEVAFPILHLKELYLKFGTKGLLAILSMPPSQRTVTKPLVTRTKRILDAIANHFQETFPKED